MKKLNIGKTTAHVILKELINEGTVTKDTTTRPVPYYLTSMAHLFEKPAVNTEI